MNKKGQGQLAEEIKTGIKKRRVTRGEIFDRAFDSGYKTAGAVVLGIGMLNWILANAAGRETSGSAFMVGVGLGMVASPAMVKAYEKAKDALLKKIANMNLNSSKERDNENTK